MIVIVVIIAYLFYLHAIVLIKGIGIKSVGQKVLAKSLRLLLEYNTEWINWSLINIEFVSVYLHTRNLAVTSFNDKDTPLYSIKRRHFTT